MRNFRVCIIDGGMLRGKEITNRAGLVFLADGRARLICWVVMRAATGVYVLMSRALSVAASMQAKKRRMVQSGTTRRNYQKWQIYGDYRQLRLKRFAKHLH